MNREATIKKIVEQLGLLYISYQGLDENQINLFEAIYFPKIKSLCAELAVNDKVILPSKQELFDAAVKQTTNLQTQEKYKNINQGIIDHYTRLLPDIKIYLKAQNLTIEPNTDDRKETLNDIALLVYKLGQMQPTFNDLKEVANKAELVSPNRPDIKSPTEKIFKLFYYSALVLQLCASLKPDQWPTPEELKSILEEKSPGNTTQINIAVQVYRDLLSNAQDPKYIDGLHFKAKYDYHTAYFSNEIKSASANVDLKFSSTFDQTLTNMENGTPTALKNAKTTNAFKGKDQLIEAEEKLQKITQACHSYLNHLGPKEDNEDELKKQKREFAVAIKGITDNNMCAGEKVSAINNVLNTSPTINNLSKHQNDGLFLTLVRWIASIFQKDAVTSNTNCQSWKNSWQDSARIGQSDSDLLLKNIQSAVTPKHSG